MATSADIFGLDTVYQVGAAAVRVRFTETPTVLSATGAADALNPALYAPRGPTDNKIVKVAAVPADPNAVDVLFAAALTAGGWVIAVQGVRSRAGSALTGVSLLAFNAVAPFTEPVAAGFSNADAAQVLRNNFNPAIVGPNTDAILAALAAGDQTNVDNAKLIFDQLYKSSAVGKYLSDRASDYGVQRPAGIGMSDDLYRQLAILLGSRKLTHESVWKALEIYFGVDAVRAHVTSLPEPFALADGDTLVVGTTTVTLASADFAKISSAKSVEVAAAINRACSLVQAKEYAISYRDVTTGLNHVRIYADRVGFGGRVQIGGGRAQSVLQFPNTLVIGAVSTQWLVAPSSVGRLRFTFVGGPDPVLDPVLVGDSVNVYGVFPAAHRGSFPIIALKVDASTAPRTIWFEIASSSSLTATTALTATTDLVFFRPQTAVQPSATVNRSDVNVLDVVLPTTSQGVGRGPVSGAYLHEPPTLPPPFVGDIDPFSVFSMPIASVRNQVPYISRDGNGVVTVTSESPHGLSVGAQIIVDNVYAAPTDVDAWAAFGSSMREPRQRHTTTLLANGSVLVTGGINAGGAVVNTAELFDPTAGTWTSTPNMSTQRYDHRATLLADGRVLVTGGFTQGGVAVASAEIFNPVTGLWAPTQSMAVARAGHVAVLLRNSAVLVVGGNTSSYTYEIYQPWTTVTGNLGARGTLRLMLGGSTSSQGSWTSFVVTAAGSLGGALGIGGGRLLGGSIATVGLHAGMAVLLDGHVLVAGGLVGGAGIAGSWLFSPESLSWSNLGNLPVARGYHTCSMLPNGKVLAVGGTPDGTSGLTSCALYDPATGQWTAVASLNNARFGHRAVVLNSGLVLVFGGQHNGTVLASAEIYDPVANTWAASTDSIPSVRPLTEARSFFGAVYFNNKVHAIGGATTASGTLSDLERFPREMGSGGLNGIHTVTAVPSATQFQFVTPDYPYVLIADSGSVTPVKAPVTDGVPGPYILNPTDGVAITVIGTSSAAAFSSGSQVSALPVADASEFPDEPGYLVFGFGSARQQGPVPYLGRLSPTALLIDSSFVLTSDLVVGDGVSLLLQKGPWTPESPEEIGAFYATDSNSGRVAAAKTLSDMIGVGVDMDVTVLYPGDFGLGGSGSPANGAAKLSDKVAVWAGDDVDAEVELARAS